MSMEPYIKEQKVHKGQRSFFHLIGGNHHHRHGQRTATPFDVIPLQWHKLIASSSTE